MNKEELIGKLQMVYAGDINALNVLIGYYDGLKECIEIVQQENKELKEDIKGLQCEKQVLYNTIHDLKKANKKLDRKLEKAIEKLYCWGEALNPEFQKTMLDILNGVE